MYSYVLAPKPETASHSFNLFPTYDVQYYALSLYIYYLHLFSTWITGTEKQLTVNMWKCTASNDVTLFVLPFHSCISHM